MVKSYLWALLVRVYCCVFCNISQFLREVVPYLGMWSSPRARMDGIVKKKNTVLLLRFRPLG